MKEMIMPGMLALLVAAPLAAGEAAPAEPLDPAKLPANQWVDLGSLPGLRKPAGYQVGGMWSGLAYAAEAKGLLFPEDESAVIGTWRLSWAKKAWEPFNPETPDQYAQKQAGRCYEWDPQGYWVTSDNRKVPIFAPFYTNQVGYDSDRKVLVGLAKGNIFEFDLTARKWSLAKEWAEGVPPVVTAGSLGYDPVNKECVLATGGFSEMGGTDGTWLYDGAKKSWRKLEGPKEIDEVRLPLQQARDRLFTLRWLVWKNTEFRATGREKLLDECSKGEALAREASELAAEMKKLGELAGTNSAKAQRPYHQGCLAAAGKLLGEAVGKLNGGDARLKAGSPEELEALYRGNLVPALEAVEKTLTELAVTPEPRMNAKLVYDSKNRLIVCFGGDRQDGWWADTWVYHCEGRWWERRHPAAHPPARPARAMAFEEHNGVTVFIESPQWEQQRDSATWTYDAARNEWRRLGIPVSPTAFWLEYDATAGCLAAFSADFSKCWALRLDAASAKALEAKPAPEAELLPTDGPYVLRDAATVADLRKWQAEMDGWAKNLPANTWTPAPTRGTGRPQGGRTWSSIVYDPDRLQIYYRDGGHGSYHGSVTDHYDVPTGRWFRSARREEPPWPHSGYFAWGRAFSYAPFCMHTYRYGLFYNPLVKRLQRGAVGQGSLPRAYAYSEKVHSKGLPHHDYDPDTGAWSREFGFLADLTKDDAQQLVVPGAPDRLLAISPWIRYGPKPTTSVWQRTAEGEKTWANTGPLPMPHFRDAGLCVFFDPKRNRAMYLGGEKGKPGLFALDVSQAEPRWQKLETSAAGGALPEPGREVVYVPKHDVFLMLEGKEGPLSVCSLTPGDNAWRKLELSGAPANAGGILLGLQYDPVSDLCFFIQAEGNPPPMFAFRYAPDAKKE